jgi:DNA-binding Lrp family transcriptional regulator
VTERELDAVDEHILAVLQRDGRATMTELAKGLDVSANTVRNRIRAMEAAGIIEGYTAVVDYHAAEFPLHYQFTCTASIRERSRLADAALAIPGVLGVRELMTGQRNVLIEAVGEDRDDITRIAEELDELGLEVVEEALVRRVAHRVSSPFEDRVAGADAETGAGEDAADVAAEEDGGQ